MTLPERFHPIPVTSAKHVICVSVYNQTRSCSRVGLCCGLWIPYLASCQAFERCMTHPRARAREHVCVCACVRVCVCVCVCVLTLNESSRSGKQSFLKRCPPSNLARFHPSLNSHLDSELRNPFCSLPFLPSGSSSSQRINYRSLWILSSPLLWKRISLWDSCCHHCGSEPSFMLRHWPLSVKSLWCFTDNPSLSV